MVSTENKKIFLENDSVKVSFDADNGGKVYSFFSKKTGTEFLYTDPREVFYPEKGFPYHNLSGIDECFPTVGRCTCDRGHYKGRKFNDHGHLWQQSWNFMLDKDSFLMSVNIPEFDISFQRRCRLEDESTLVLEYEILNNSDAALPYIYSTHPLLFADEKTLLELPDEVTKVYNYVSSDNVNIENNTWHDLPLPDNADLTGPYSRNKEIFAKLFTQKLTNGWGKFRHTGIGQSFKVEFDNEKLPYMGILISQGHDSLGDGDFKGELLVAIEPTTGIGDDLIACSKTNTVSTLEAGQKINFWIRFSILSE